MAKTTARTDLALAASLANLLFIRAWFSILYDADFGYFNRQPVNTATLLSLLLNMVVLTGLLWAAVTCLRRQPWPWLRRLAVLAVLASFLIPLNFVRLSVLGIPGSSVLALARNPLVLAAGVLGGVAVWNWASAVGRGVRGLLLILLPLSVVSVGKLMLVLLGILSLQQHHASPPLAPLLPEPRTRPRVVWLVFDEMDYRLAFPERPPGLCLPELDRLRSESLFALHARPPAYGTLLSMPALTTGFQVSGGEPCSPFDLQVVLTESGEKRRWSQMPNLFKDAREAGYNIAVVAWHHPYRRVFSNLVSFCEWYPSPVFEQARGPDMTTAALNQWCSILAPLQQRRLQVQIQQRSMAAVLQVVTNRQFGFLFFHLPPPHKPGIYRPETDSFTIWEFSTTRGYFNNLILADRMLGRLRRELEAQGDWDQTWLLVTADHSWRESRRYDGRWDERIPWLLKAPGPGKKLEHAIPFNTVASRHLFSAIWRGEVCNLDEAHQWLKENAPDLPPAEGASRFDH